MNRPVLLSVRNYRQHFQINSSLTIRAVDGISFELLQGEIFGLVGESGCGKSTVARAVMGICTPTEGEIFFKDCLISEKSSRRKKQKDIQRNLQVIFQDSAAALNPRMRVCDIIEEPLLINNLYPDKHQRRAETHRLLSLVGLDPGYADKFPGELSGGQRQRIAIARSIATKPELIVADEPVASLDTSIQAQIVSLFQELQHRQKLTLLFIAHDLSLVHYLCERTGVMLAGKLVELAPTKELFQHPLHPYTRSLISSIPVPDPVYERTRKRLPCITGMTKPGSVWSEVTPGHFLLI